MVTAVGGDGGGGGVGGSWWLVMVTVMVVVTVMLMAVTEIEILPTIPLDDFIRSAIVVQQADKCSSDSWRGTKFDSMEA
ncbi:hypothetical protein OSB04_023916 [Centaurea solstitialis]|uniref:Uncharacterized protein n=1 Tax=Centaurea solstitialis TaxID=347529 RepID=A0AA38SLT7_9ASTR|nr:hypothetical protein OSB04_023916 [Centaurea solstitialis]